MINFEKQSNQNKIQGEPQMKKKLLVLLIAMIALIYSNASDANESINLEKESHVFVENGVEDYFSSPYVFIIPKGIFDIHRSVKDRYNSSLESVLETNKENSRYLQNRGFVYFRSSNDALSHYGYNTSQNIRDDISSILTNEGNQYDLHFYGFKDNFVFSDFSDVYTYGSIFSSHMKNNIGLFFIRKLKPLPLNFSYYSSIYQYSSYIIYYDYINDFDRALEELNYLTNCMYIISSGCIKKCDISPIKINVE